MIDNQPEEPNHSNVNTTLKIELNDEVTLDKGGAVYISDHNNRGFRIKTALFYFAIHAILIFWTFYYLHDDHGKHENLKKWFRNYDYIGCGYDIAFTCVLLVCIIVLSFWVKLARSAAGYGLMAIILGSYVYLTGFVLRIACKARYDLDEEITKMLVGVWCGGIGLLVACFLPNQKFNKTIGMAISMPLYIIMLILWRYAYRLDNPKYMITLAYIAATGFYCWYINTCMWVMVNKRQQKYLTSDAVLAFANLQTDIFAMFWVDLIRKKKKAPVEEPLEMAEDQKTTSSGSNSNKSDR